MEADPFLQSILLDYDHQSNLLFQPIHCNGYGLDDLPFSTLTQDGIHHDDVSMDAMLYLDEDVLNDQDYILMSPGEAHLPSTTCDVVLKDSSPQDEVFDEMGGSHNLQQLGLTDLLLMCAEAVESENCGVASTLIARLEHLLFNVENESSPFLRLAYWFTQGLRSRAVGHHPAPPSPVLVSEDMSAYQMVQELSPFVKFAHFTANQAILEATQGDSELHIIDLNVMEGIQWPPLMVDLANRNSAASLHITAIVADGGADEVHQTGRRLIEFSESIGLPLRFDQLELQDLERLQVGKGSVIANCMVQNTQTPSISFRSARNFLSKARKFSPKMVVMVEDELLSSTKASSMPFVEFFCEALHHFSSVSDSLACSFYGGYKVGLKLVEKEMLGPKIMDYITHFPFGLFSMEGFRLTPLSSCNVAQAKYLLALFNRGFSVEHANGQLALCWKSRPLTTVSLWVPN